MTPLRKAALIIAAAALSAISIQSAWATSPSHAIRHAVISSGVLGCCPGQ